MLISDFMTGFGALERLFILGVNPALPVRKGDKTKREAARCESQKTIAIVTKNA
jgi:hypothetical protein